MMFSIDLLKGKGLPQKRDMKKSLLRAVPILIPLLAVSVLAASYQRNSETLQDQRRTLVSNQQQIAQYTRDVMEYNTIEARIKGLEKCIKDISRALSYRIQVSDVLMELVQTLPDSIFIYEMNMNRNAVNEKIQQEGSAEVKQRLVVRRQLKLVLCGYDAEKSDMAVQDYVSELGKSPLLNGLFVEIKPSARQQGEVDGRPAIYYEIDCVLREQGS
jgi:Tfp pilus assembly protein PilN